MNDKVDVQKELEKLTPKLAELKKEEISRPSVPEDYFNRLPDEVLRRARADRKWQQEKAPASTRRKIFSVKSINSGMRLALAACFLLLLGGAYWAVFVMPATKEGFVTSIDQLEHQEINEYIEENISDFDLPLMLEAEVVDSETMDDLFAAGISEEDMDALMDELLEGIDLDELEEAL